MNKFRISTKVSDSGISEPKKDHYSKKIAASKAPLSFADSHTSIGSQETPDFALTTSRSLDQLPYDRRNSASSGPLACKKEILPSLENVSMLHAWERLVDDYLNANFYDRRNSASSGPLACKKEILPSLENVSMLHAWERLVDDYLNANSMTLPDLAKHFLMLEEEESRRPDGFEKRIVVSIDAWWKFYWDIGIILLFIYTSFQVPYALAFDDGQALDFTTFWQVWNLFMDCVYMFDIVLAFVTERYYQGLLVSRLRQIGSLYLREEFALDFAGSFPFDKVVAAIVRDTGGTRVDLAALRVFKVIRLLRLLRGAKIVKFVQALEERTRGKLSRVVHLVQSVLVLIFTAHTLGCFFVLLATSEEDWDYDVNWLRAYSPDLDPSVGGQEYRRYVACLYWAIITISTMGYGDVLPVTTPERCYVIFVALVGSVVFAYCMNNIGQMLSASSGVEDALRSNQRHVREYMEYRSVSIPLQQRVFY
eukprot:CAMPEP_0172205396 /NCGR_PEP_ID=MMETSP1050-20130122/32584_1 /TAXON_ID=233186 /ORGANISM="Cryptomonas curvata, Strain CCAP979/52" /LENGTH=478 /DNA_ID=CAMNT_0012884253 /DNA_START=219 /DNA_END=1652 /DNA_ORIENTATION=+